MENFEVFPSQQLGYLGKSTTSRQIDKCNFQILGLGTRSNNKLKLHVPSQSTIGLASKTRLLKSLDKGALCLGHPFRAELPGYFLLEITAGRGAWKPRSLSFSSALQSQLTAQGTIWWTILCLFLSLEENRRTPENTNPTPEELQSWLHGRILRLTEHIDGAQLLRISLELWPGNSRKSKDWTKKWTKSALQISSQVT